MDSEALGILREVKQLLGQTGNNDFLGGCIMHHHANCFHSITKLSYCMYVLVVGCFASCEES